MQIALDSDNFDVFYLFIINFLKPVSVVNFSTLRFFGIANKLSEELIVDLFRDGNTERDIYLKRDY